MNPRDFLRSIFAKNARKDSEVFSQPADIFVSTLGLYNFYRDAYRNLLFMALFLGTLIIGLILFACWVVLAAKPQDRFFVAAVDGRVERIMPLDVPVASDNEMISRLAAGLSNSMTFGYLDFDARRVENQSLFTPASLDQLLKALLGDGGVERMTQDERVYKTEVDKSVTPLILREGVNKDFVYEWVFQIGLTVTSWRGINEEAEAKTPWVVQILVQRAQDVGVTRGYLIASVLHAAPVPVKSADGAKRAP